MIEDKELEILKEYIKVHQLSKQVDEKKKELGNRVKEIMQQENLKDFNLDGKHFNISETYRTTVTKKTKEEFIQKLIDAGKQSLISTEPVLDIEGILIEMKAGIINPEFVKKYMNITPVKTLKLT